MRDIQFRGLYQVRDKKYEKRMVYGQLDLKPNNDARITYYGKTSKGKNYRRSVFVDFRTIGQLTNIEDMHGNKLYEGDICFNPNDETWGEVIWDEGAWCYKWDNIIENLHDCAYLIESTVGNIHQNADILEKN